MFQKSFSHNKFRFKKRFNRFNQGKRSFGKRFPQESIHASRYVNKTATTTPEVSYVVKHSFNDFQIDNRLKQNILARGFSVPTPIQDQAIPHMLNGKDVVGIANTGTGKTAAFLIPLINKILLNRSEKVLIIIPTRELAAQINDEVKFFARGLNIYSLLCIGGANIRQQMFILRQNPNIIIATPGRLKDLIERRAINLGQFKNIVLDEVDRMLDIGFIREIKYVISLLSPARQSLFFSATVSAEINTIIQSFMTNPITVSVKLGETAENIEQDIVRVRDKRQKVEKLTAMLKQEEFKKVLIFGRTKWGVEKLSKLLQQSGFAAASIHGNKPQNNRLRVLGQFKQNQLQVLVATDIAARGLDIEDVSHVINFDEPKSYNDYVHRIGRTGRANKQGKALTFVESQP
jgi:superfamily II DNA/RNA helicase